MQSQAELLSAQAKHCHRLAQVISMTQQMLRLAEAGDWDQVAVMELDRREDLLACFDDTPPPADTELDAQAIATLLMLNEELMARLKSARKSVLQQNKAFAQNRSAASTYQAVEASS